MTDQDRAAAVSWRTVRAGTPVRAADGEVVGRLVSVEADAEEDIFHGLVVDTGADGRHTLVPRDVVAGMAPDSIDLSVDSAAVKRFGDLDRSGASSGPLGRRDRWGTEG